MRRVLAILLLLAPVALAEPAPGAREIFPSDYKPSPCAAEGVCRSFNQSQMAEVAAIRGFDIGQEWVDAHWKEVTEAIRPSCAKVATCFAAPGSSFTFCNDLLAPEVYKVCDRYPEGSTDREKCSFFIRTFWAGHDRKSKGPWTEAQACTTKAAGTAAAERTLEHWIVPATIGRDYKGSFVVYALDSDTKVPVRARVIVPSKTPVYAEDSADGLPTTFGRVPWRPKLVRVPNAQGHHDLAAPEIRIEAPGYRTESFRLPMTAATMTVEMSPPPKKLKKGKNRVTITARDTVTGEPVEARVMGGYIPIGRTNEPFELDLSGKKRPEIWVTNLYDLYSDVVVARAEK